MQPVDLSLSTLEALEFARPEPATTSDGPVRASLSAHRRADGTVTACIVLVLDPGWYAYGPGSPDGLPVAVAPTPGLGLRLAALPTFPAGFDDPHLHGYVPIEVALRGESDQISLEIRVQACNDSQCLPPATLSLTCTATRE